MIRKRVIRKSTEFNDINKKHNDDQQKIVISDSSFDIVQHAGGSINNLTVKTKEFNTWLDAHRVNNPFIGKHVTYAPEEYTSEIRLNDDTVLDDESLRIFTEADSLGMEKFDPNSTFGLQVEEVGDSLKGDNTHESKFIDLSIVENVTKKYLLLSDSDIELESIRIMKQYHSDDAYVSDIDIDSITKETKLTLIEYKPECDVNREQLRIQATTTTFI